MNPHRHVRRRFPLNGLGILACLITTLLLAGCQTTDPTPSKGKARQEPIMLQKGMSGDAVRAVLGDPVAIKPGNAGLETWVYEDSREVTRYVEAETREVPYIDPVTKEEKFRTEAVKKLQTKRITLTTELFIRDGVLVGWVENLDESSDWQD